ncbi:MAG: tRNA (N6-isopentenyl adenosine(37)-C2)-methylthiotransferase MiaB [Candidatus Omnitrophica bacterium]|nr:tRNA (N6-isopentenyl adenosine(37)-C2)-methylthiotransferase MiaB [Candidatus Omnitrophota bacterium]
MKKKDTVVDSGPPQIPISSKSKSKRGGHLTSKCHRVYIRTFGCQMNEHDSGRVRDMLLDSGYAMTDDPAGADVLLFNTCSVRKNAEDRVFGVVSSLKAVKKKRPRVVFGILGCMAEARKQDIFAGMGHVDFICGPADLDKVPKILKKVFSGDSRLMYVGGHKSGRLPGFSKKRRQGKTAYVKIAEGCNNFCSYCIVPYVRGRERSRPSRDILREIRDLVNNGTRDIILLGQNVNSYGKGLKEKIDFPGLLKKIDKVVRRDCPPSGEAAGFASLAMTKVKVSFVTSHPKDAGTGLFKAVAGLKSLSKQLHLPLQSGSNKILKRMNRGYTVGKYKKLVKDFRNIVKDGRILSDFIVGFPGETKKDFNETLKAVKEVRFNSAYIFKYSPRPFTKAAELKDNIPEKEKERRHKILLDAQRKISRKNI